MRAATGVPTSVERQVRTATRRRNDLPCSMKLDIREVVISNRDAIVAALTEGKHPGIRTAIHVLLREPKSP